MQDILKYWEKSAHLLGLIAPTVFSKKNAIIVCVRKTNKIDLAHSSL